MQEQGRHDQRVMPRVFRADTARFRRLYACSELMRRVACLHSRGTGTGRCYRRHRDNACASPHGITRTLLSTPTAQVEGFARGNAPGQQLLDAPSCFYSPKPGWSRRMPKLIENLPGNRRLVSDRSWKAIFRPFSCDYTRGTSRGTWAPVAGPPRGRSSVGTPTTCVCPRRWGVFPGRYQDWSMTAGSVYWAARRVDRYEATAGHRPRLCRQAPGEHPPDDTRGCRQPEPPAMNPRNHR